MKIYGRSAFYQDSKGNSIHPFTNSLPFSDDNTPCRYESALKIPQVTTHSVVAIVEVKVTECDDHITARGRDTWSIDLHRVREDLVQQKHTVAVLLKRVQPDMSSDPTQLLSESLDTPNHSHTIDDADCSISSGDVCEGGLREGQGATPHINS